MIKEALQYLHSLARPAIVTDSLGREYSTLNVSPLIRQPAPLSITTLTGLVDYIQFEWGMNALTDILALHVMGHDKVELVSALSDTWDTRNVYARANPTDFKSFMFGSWLSAEQFIIELQAKFVDTPDKAQVLAYIGNLRSELVATSTDDGISQEVAVRNKIGRLENVTLDPIVTLAPYRTFREVPQPESKFLLRLKNNGTNQLPSVALFEADGGAWKLEAIESIKASLIAALQSAGTPEVSVIA